MFDLLIKGGHVIDPANHIDDIRDVAVIRGRIAAVDSAIAQGAAVQTYDASGMLVMPGLIDIHTHVYRGVTFWGTDPNVIAPNTGVTTWVDAGSAGAFTIDGLREFIVRPSCVRILAYLNISALGLVAHNYELTNLDLCDEELFEMAINRNRDLVVGGKIRLGVTTIGQSGLVPLGRALNALSRCELPLMVHIAEAPPHPREFADQLRAGDVVTHCFTNLGMKLVNDQGQLHDFAKRWLDRGVLLDVGHGTSSFTYAVAEPLIAAGVKPDFISTDLHQNNTAGPTFDLPTTMSKFVSLGMSLFDVVERVTIRPARFLGLQREIGSLGSGSIADIAVFRMEESEIPLYDGNWQPRPARQLLHNVATFYSGRLLPRLGNSVTASAHDWARGGRDRELYARQDLLRQSGHVPGYQGRPIRGIPLS
jgi:dihydroorotase